MKRTIVCSTLLLLAGCSSLGGAGSSAGAGSIAGTGTSKGGASPAEREARHREMDAAQGTARREELARYVDQYVNRTKRQTLDVEEKLLAGARVALGEEKARGAREIASVAATIGKLKAVGVHPKLVANPEFQQGFLRPDGKAFTADLEKVPRDKNQETRYVISDLAAQTTTITWAAYLASQQQIGLHLQTVAVAGAVVANRKKYSLAPSPEDVAIVKKALDQARRGDELAAAGAGMSAAMVAVTNGRRPAKVLEDMSRTVKQSIPSKAAATDEEAKAYLDGFESGLGDARARYESMLKSSYGTDWERSGMKQVLDESFKMAEAGITQRSEAERRAERAERRAERADDRGATSSPASHADGARPTAPGALDTAKSLLPSDGPIGGAIGVLDSLRRGDATGAIKGALGFVPPGPLKTGLNLVASLF